MLKCLLVVQFVRYSEYMPLVLKTCLHALRDYVSA